MLSTAILVALAFAQAPKYGKCSKDNFDRKDLINVNIPIQKVLTQSPIEVSGNIYIIDGCSFGVRDFVFQNADASFWVGGYKGSGEAMTLSNEQVQASATSSRQTFNLRQEVGAEANFDGFNQFRLFARGTGLLIATADFPARGSVTPASSTSAASGTNTATTTSLATTTRSTTTSSSTSTTTTKSGASVELASIYSLSLALLFSLFW
jgi:hypothetical protein